MLDNNINETVWIVSWSCRGFPGTVQEIFMTREIAAEKVEKLRSYGFINPQMLAML